MNSAMMNVVFGASGSKTAQQTLSGKTSSNDKLELFKHMLMANNQKTGDMAKSQKTEADINPDMLRDLIKQLDELITGISEASASLSEEEASILSSLKDLKDKLANGMINEATQLMKSINAIGNQVTEETSAMIAEGMGGLLQLARQTTGSPPGGESGKQSTLSDLMPIKAHAGGQLAPEMSGKYAQVEAMTVQQANKQLQDLWQQFTSILNQTSSSNGGELTKQSGLQLKQLFQQWTALAQKISPLSSDLPSQVVDQGTAKQQKIWGELLGAFRNRHTLQTSQTYSQQASVSGKDVAKWLQQALTRNSGDETSSVKQQPSQVNWNTMSMSKVEQFVLHMNQNQDTSMQKQLMQEFERILKMSKFQVNRSGDMELQMKLKPSNLGNMVVKMTQVNGEMAVKIMVSSQAAKDMMDGNLNQLRHMFSPQQVIIEKQEQLGNNQMFMENGEHDEHWQEDGQREQAFEDEEDEEADENAVFHDILMNEKV
ncbi:flagellar hook-length control protein FliK [Thalassobacillus sp. CUG 92003]|uniref:flagellar hook-length control protein FliK n=1 Tax=Thalassobacillus sp. CUG 92003 TaxID=2736641 RepID=UPI0015E7481A|nr:flagellar hook-length control protein FliK [Thalassobacillus sp. CUG 92003]